jgi:tRNA(His) 5'-end guanylyltransferase
MDQLGDRMKAYEDVSRYSLPRKSYVIIRLDGKAFHTYTRGLVKPFDEVLMEHLDKATLDVMTHIQNVKLAYVQSDEISLLLSDNDTIETSAWFDNNVQKMASVSASVMTAHFNKYRFDWFENVGLKGLRPFAYFDSRIWVIPQVTEVANYFVWRTRDCIRNAINTIAQSEFSHKELQGKSLDEVKQMLVDKQIDINSVYTPYMLNGRLFVNGERTQVPSENLFQFYNDFVKELTSPRD